MHNATRWYEPEKAAGAHSIFVCMLLTLRCGCNIVSLLFFNVHQISTCDEVQNLEGLNDDKDFFVSQ